LNALSKTSWADFLQFKGGTSLSKAWGLIKRFSEDIDLAINRSCFKSPEGNPLPDDTAQQRTAIRRKAFHFIEKKLIGELDKALQSNGINDYEIKLVTENSSAMAVTVEVRYRSILATIIDYVLPVVKIEFSAMSLNEPYQEQEITTFIHHTYPDIDNEIKCLFRTVLPERTFLEKLFLLHEEYQKDSPRTIRMSRHLYDLEKMMDTSFAQSALQDTDLYKTIVCHREKFNNIQNIDYQSHCPDKIQICPPDRLLKEWEDDYRQLQQSFIYDDSKMTFAELTERLQELTNRIRNIKCVMF
jgi:predicted nucleotidyltransferase component of viral defense system